MNATCPGCQTKLRVADSLAGKRAKCSKCGAILDIPAAAPGGGEAPREGEAPAEPSSPAAAPSGSPAGAERQAGPPYGESPRSGSAGASPSQMAEELGHRGLGAVLISFKRDGVDIEHFEDATFDLACSSNLTEAEMRSVLLRIGIAVARQAVKGLPPPLPG